MRTIEHHTQATMKFNKSNKQVKKEITTLPQAALPVVTLDEKEMSVVSGGGVVMGD